jgi:hypothetical protein
VKWVWVGLGICEKISVWSVDLDTEVLISLIAKQNIGCFDLLIECEGYKYLFPLDYDLLAGKKLRYLVCKYTKMALESFASYCNLLPALNF